MQPGYISPKEAGAIVGRSTKTIALWATTHKIDGFQLMGRWEINRQSLLDYDYMAPKNLHIKKQRRIPSYKLTNTECPSLRKVLYRMRKRCYNSNCAEYKYYGGRGIGICKEWDNPNAFLSWALSNGYKPGLTIDRIDNNGDYSPENCRWATMKEQNANRRDNIFITINGVTKVASHWAKEKGVSPVMVICRYKQGLTGDDLFSPPKGRHT